MQAYILLDRSGSMQSLWVEELSSVNAFAKELANKKDGPAVDSHVTLAVFDSQETLQFDVLRRKQAALHWENVTDKDASVVPNTLTHPSSGVRCSRSTRRRSHNASGSIRKLVSTGTNRS